jgi:hypothetical protein
VPVERSTRRYCSTACHQTAFRERRVICIAFTAEAFEATWATLPLGCVAFEPTIDKKGDLEARAGSRQPLALLARTGRELQRRCPEAGQAVEKPSAAWSSSRWVCDPILLLGPISVSSSCNNIPAY